jgi:threonyl-tRNA synthetase
MIKIKLPDGNVREYAQGTTGMDIALSISEGLARNVLAAKVNGKVVDASLPINEDSDFQLLTWNDLDGKATFWHSSAHLMAEAVEALYPGVKFWVGPALDKGFYYDIDLGDRHLTDDDLIAIERKMNELAKAANTFNRKEISKADAITYFTDADESEAPVSYKKQTWELVKKGISKAVSDYLK